ncbi:MAG TPA: DUF401 family protein [Nitrososphaeria archaeon]|nr:DUF401 family protein [Nitrososphaeria archaeon]
MMPYIDLTIALTVSIIIVLALIFRKINIAASLAVGSMIFGLLAFGPLILQVLPQAFNIPMIRTLLALILAMFLAELYGSAGASRKLVEGLTFFSPSFAALATPAIIGLLPMPGGAYVSAVILNELYGKLRLNAESKTFINYWFRHIWITTWPLYQSVILASGLLGISIRRISILNLPITLAATLIGAVAGMLIIRRSADKKCSGEGRRGVKGLLHVWPFLLIALTAVALHVDLVISLALVVLSVIAVYRPPKKDLARSLRQALNPTFIAIIVFSFIYSEFIEESGVAHSLAAKLSPLADLAAFAIPFLIVIGTGVEFTFVALAFPPLAPMLKASSGRLLLAFTGGFAGALLSPAHACLILSSEYYKAELQKVYRILIPSTITTATIILLIKTALY